MASISKDFYKKEIKGLIMISLGALITSIAINWFISSAGLYVGGVTGISQLIQRYSAQHFGISLNLGLLIWSINIPLLLLAYRFIGKKFTYHTLFTVSMMTLCLNLVPRQSFSDDLLLNVILGGALNAAGGGIILKYGGSTGGVDVLSQYLSIKKSGSFGKYSFYVNCIIIAIAGSMEGWEIAFYTILLIFIQMQVIDHIHAPHESYTVFIVTNKKQEVIDTLQEKLSRGITALNAEGTYTHEDKSLLMMVVSSYEVYIALEALHRVDPFAFTNVLHSVQVQGNFGRKIVDKLG